MSYSDRIWKTALTANDATAQEELGALRTEADGKIYRYVKNGEASTALAARNLCIEDTTYPGVWTVLKSAAAVVQHGVRGFAIGAITAAYHGWIQCGGVAAGTAAETIAIGAGVCGSTTAGKVGPANTTVATGAGAIFGTANATLAGSITVTINGIL